MVEIFSMNFCGIHGKKSEGTAGEFATEFLEYIVKKLEKKYERFSVKSLEEFLNNAAM